MCSKILLFLSVVLAVAIVPAVSRAATAVMVVGVGNSSLWEMGEAATGALLAGKDAQHYTFGACSPGNVGNCAQMLDSRLGVARSGSCGAPTKAKFWRIWSPIR